MIIPNTFNWNMSAQGIVVSENILPLYLHTLMNQRNLVKESHLMIKHLMMLSTGNHEKIGDHYEKQMKAKTGFAVIMILFTAVLSSRKDKLREHYGIEGTVLRDGAANRMVGKEAVGEWIFLTEDRFFFASHAINRTTDGAEEEFIVNDHSEWIGFLKEKCGM